MDGEQIVREMAERVRALVDDAERRAAEIVREAEAEAQRIRGEAEAEARQRLDQVRQALERLEAGLGAGSAPGESSTEPAPEAAKSEISSSQPEAREPEPAAIASNEAPSDDGGAARLVAMKLALDGTSREEARRQLATDYDLADLDALLEDVYSRVQS
jgi:TolA-binding protein